MEIKWMCSIKAHNKLGEKWKLVQSMAMKMTKIIIETYNSTECSNRSLENVILI